MYGYEKATARWQPQSPFEGLAKRAGLSTWDCQLAAAAGGGKLGRIVQLAELRSGPSRGRGMPAAVALARVRAREAGLV